MAGDLRQRGPFLLAFAVGQQLRALLARALADAPLTADEFAVYSVLFATGPTTPTRLAGDLGMPASTMSHYLRRMGERGHLDRRTNPDDGRSSLVVLTADGRAATEACFPPFGAAISSFRANLRMPEADLLAALEKMSEAIAATPTPPIDHEPRGVDTPSTMNPSS